MFLIVLFSDNNLISIYICNNTVCRSNAGCTRIAGNGMFHAGSDICTVRIQQRYCLSLHVGAHQCTVSVIIFQEWYACCRNRYDLSWRDVGIVYLISVDHDCFTGNTGNDLVSDNSAVL